MHMIFKKKFELQLKSTHVQYHPYLIRQHLKKKVSLKFDPFEQFYEKLLWISLKDVFVFFIKVNES